ncbi:MAG TPA: succinate dehydrogenase/fumarate reductase iron-sulfur subunit, partial [Solibacterales bacterium]|nr:succinate dehydrogenase/fumarate reductase iron-sulfur subunit [Bryobacterales bacterium]
MNLTLHVWRQKSRADKGRLVRYEAKDVNPDMSFLEMLDVLNERLIEKGEDPIVFEHDCREGICGSCGFVINGVAHGPQPGTTVCQLHMRHYKDGDVLYLEPWRARAFPVLKDLMVDRGSLDRVIAAGGYVSVSTGSAPDGNAILISKEVSDMAMDAAACIGCG